MLERAAQGDEEAWRQLVHAYAKRIHGLIYRQCHDGDLAQEITQATFVQVVQHLNDYRERGRFEPWLFRIAMNKLRDEIRRRRRQARTLGCGPGDDEDSAADSWSQASRKPLASRQRRQSRQTPESAGAGESAGTLELEGGIGGEGGGEGGELGGGGIGGDPAERLSRQEELDQVRRAVARLSPADRRIIELRHTAGLGFAEIAQTLGQPLGTVLARGHRALAKLKQMLQPVLEQS